MIFKYINPKLMLVLIAILLAFGSSINHEFVWDDHVIVKNEKFQDVGALPWVLTTADSTSASEEAPYYRPVTYLSFFIDNQLFGDNSSFYHLEQLFLHIVSVLLLYSVVWLCFRQQILPFITSLLFAIHPLVAEPVNFISARNNIFCLIFMLLSIYSLVKGTEQGESRKWKWYVLASFAYLLSMLSKEPGAMLILFVFGGLLCNRRLWQKDSLQILGGLGVSALLYLILRSVALSGSSAGLALSDSPKLIVLSMFSYFKLVFWPVGLHPAYRTLSQEIGSLEAALGLLGFVVLVVLVVKRRNRPEGFGALWLLVCFLPIANIIPIPSSPVADRYLYIPLPGFALIAAAGIQWVFLRQRMLTIIIIVPLVLSLTLLSYKRTVVWKNNITLWQDATEQDPLDSEALCNLGVAYMGQGSFGSAYDTFARAIEVNPSKVKAHIALGLLYRQKSQYNLAIDSYQEALKFAPDDTKALYNLGNVYVTLKEYTRAKQLFLKVVALDPEYWDAYNNLIYILRKEGRIDEAQVYVEKVLKLRTGSAIPPL